MAGLAAARTMAVAAVAADDWTDLAACRGMDPDAFFGRNLTEARAAIRTCERCDVREACLDYAIDQGIEIGVWGGMTERQRRAHVRARRISA